MKKLLTTLAAVAAASPLFGAYAAEGEGKIFLGCNGNRNNFGLTGFTREWQLAETEPGVFAGSFSFLPVEALQFCFYEVEADYDAEGVCPVEADNFTIYGPGRPGRFSTMNIGFDESAIGWFVDEGLTFTGDGAWQITDWPGGAITFTVDFNKEESQVSLFTEVNPDGSGIPAGIGAVAPAEEGEAVCYDLQGRRIARPERGLFIREGKIRF